MSHPLHGRYVIMESPRLFPRILQRYLAKWSLWPEPVLISGWVYRSTPWPHFYPGTERARFRRSGWSPLNPGETLVSLQNHNGRSVRSRGWDFPNIRGEHGSDREQRDEEGVDSHHSSICVLRHP